MSGSPLFGQGGINWIFDSHRAQDWPDMIENGQMPLTGVAIDIASDCLSAGQ